MALALTGRASAIIGAAVTLIVVLSVVGAVAGDLFTSIGNVNENFTAGDTGDTTSNTIAGVMPLLIGVTFILGLAGLVIGAINFRRG
jgi:hypothetical protein